MKFERRELTESFEVHNELNPILWDGNELKPEVRTKLQEIVDYFILELEQKEIPIRILDVRLVGSNASFNYTDTSDLDVHIVADYDKSSCDINTLTLLYDYFKSKFNDKYDISIHNIEVELYIEDVDSTTVSNGIYSFLREKWVKYPERIDVPDVDISDVLDTYISKCEDAIDSGDVEKISKLIDELHLMRKDSIDVEGEYGKGNTLFKELRNRGYIKQLKDARKEAVSKELSLEHLNSNSSKQPLQESVDTSMQALITECKNRRIEPSDIFKDWDYLVDAKTFFNEITKDTQDSYKQNPKLRILRNTPKDTYYKVMMSYLDSLGTSNTSYEKLDPALVDKNGSPMDGRHRAQLCTMLGIPLPVKKFHVNESLDESINSQPVLYHGTSIDNLIKILKDNKLKGSTHAKDLYNKRLSSVSLTRSKKFAFDYFKSDAVIELDKDRLAQKYKISPDGDYSNFGKNPKAARFTDQESKAEEIITSDIDNISNYINSIYLKDSEYYSYIKDLVSDIPVYYNGNKLTESVNTFNTSTTGARYWDTLMKDPKFREERNVEFEIVQMTPKEYFDACAEIFKNSQQVEQVRGDREILKNLRDAVTSGSKFPITFLDYSYGNGDHPTQEGRHRMYTLAQLYGWNEKYPVAVFRIADQARRDRDREESRRDEIFEKISRALDKCLPYEYADVSEFKEEMSWKIDREFDTKNKEFDIKITDDTISVTVDGETLDVDRDIFDIGD